MRVKSYRDLEVWSKSVDLVEWTYRITAQFPRVETFGLVAQMRRCAVSIPSNLAEGSSRIHTKELLRFLSIAMGSLAELETQILISKRLGYLKETQFARFMDHATVIGKQLHTLRKSLSKK